MSPVTQKSDSPAVVSQPECETPPPQDSGLKRARSNDDFSWKANDFDDDSDVSVSSSEADTSTDTPPPPNKQARLGKPDVVVVVGDWEFHEYSQILGIASEYFDRELHPGRDRQERTTRFEFPERNPGDWEILKSYIPGLASAFLNNEPFDPKVLNIYDCDTLIDWAVELDMIDLLGACEQLLCRKTLLKKLCRRHQVEGSEEFRCPRTVSGKCEKDRQGNSTCLGSLTKEQVSDLKEDFKYLMDIMERCITAGMSKAKTKIAQHVRRVILDSPEVLERDSVSRILLLLKDQKEEFLVVWESLKQFLPQAISSENPAAICSNTILPDLIASQASLCVEKMWSKEEKKYLERKKRVETKCLEEQKETEKKAKEEALKTKWALEKHLKDVKTAVHLLPNILYCLLPVTKEDPQLKCRQINEYAHDELKREIKGNLLFRQQ